MSTIRVLAVLALFMLSGCVPIPTPIPTPTSISGNISIEYLGGEPGMVYCGHRFTATFQADDPGLLLIGVDFDFNPSQNTDFDGFTGAFNDCDAYGTLQENFSGFFVNEYPGAIPVVTVYSDNQDEAGTGIRSRERLIGRMDLKKQRVVGPGTRPNAPDLAGAKVTFTFSNGVHIDAVLKETGDFFTSSGRF